MRSRARRPRSRRTARTATSTSARSESMTAQVESAEARERAYGIWDLPVRVFHWILVLAFVCAYVTHRLGVNYFKYHVWCGYTVLVLVAFRLIWGFIGTRHALF